MHTCVCVCVYVYMCACIRECVHVCMCLYAYACACVLVCLCVCVYLGVYVCLCVVCVCKCICVCMCVYVCVCLYVCVCGYIFIIAMLTTAIVLSFFAIIPTPQTIHPIYLIYLQLPLHPANQYTNSTIHMPLNLPPLHITLEFEQLGGERGDAVVPSDCTCIYVNIHRVQILIHIYICIHIYI